MGECRYPVKHFPDAVPISLTKLGYTVFVLDMPKLIVKNRSSTNSYSQKDVRVRTCARPQEEDLIWTSKMHK